MKLSICSKGSMYQINEATKREIIKFTLDLTDSLGRSSRMTPVLIHNISLSTKH